MGFLKKLALAAMAVTLTLALGACAKEATPETQEPAQTENGSAPEEEEAPQAEAVEYVNGYDTFSIKVAGDFTQDSSVNPDQIVIDNPDRTLTIMVQKLGKTNLEQINDVQDLDQFIAFYKEKGIATLVENSQVTEMDFTTDSVLNAKADEFVATQGGQTSKAFIAYLEIEGSYYAYTITGIESLYDENIDVLKESIHTLTEKAE